MYPPHQDADAKNTNSPPVFQPEPATGVPVGGHTNQYNNQNSQFAVHHHHYHQGRPVAWSSGLCDCCSDCRNCCITCWCPCITFGQIAEIVDKGTTSCGVSGALYGLLCLFTGCTCCYSCLYRSKMRHEYMLIDSPCNDCMVHCCCESCALCQEYRELKDRGFDMSVGWQANVEGQNGRVGMVPTAPVLEEGMNR